VNNKTYCIY